jgi:hypothetical protein
MCVYDLIHEKSTISLVFIVPIVLAGDKSFFLNNENKSDSVNTVWISQRERELEKIIVNSFFIMTGRRPDRT